MIFYSFIRLKAIIERAKYVNEEYVDKFLSHLQTSLLKLSNNPNILSILLSISEKGILFQLKKLLLAIYNLF